MNTCKTHDGGLGEEGEGGRGWRRPFDQKGSFFGFTISSFTTKLFFQKKKKFTCFCVFGKMNKKSQKREVFQKKKKLEKKQKFGKTKDRGQQREKRSKKKKTKTQFIFNFFFKYFLIF